MPSIDPGDLTIDELHGRRPDDDAEIVPTDNDDDDSLPDLTTLDTECRECGEDFDRGKLRRWRAALHLNLCLGCAEDMNLELTPDESNELAEDYWSRRYDA